MAETVLRPAALGDADGIAALANAEARALHGGDDVTPDEVRSWLAMAQIYAAVA